jgi:hypothetical protein
MSWKMPCMKTFPMCECLPTVIQRKLQDGGYAKCGIPKTLEKTVYAQPVSLSPLLTSPVLVLQHSMLLAFGLYFSGHQNSLTPLLRM